MAAVSVPKRNLTAVSPLSLSQLARKTWAFHPKSEFPRLDPFSMVPALYCGSNRVWTNKCAQSSVLGISVGSYAGKRDLGSSRAGCKYWWCPRPGLTETSLGSCEARPTAHWLSDASIGSLCIWECVGGHPGEPRLRASLHPPVLVSGRGETKQRDENSGTNLEASQHGPDESVTCISGVLWQRMGSHDHSYIACLIVIYPRATYYI